MQTKSAIRAALAASLVLPTTVFATNGYQLIGVGAYQMSLGGAVTANPGSAMTAVANPAGAARVGNRADFSMEAFMPKRDVNFAGSGGSSATSAVDLSGVAAIGWTAPARAVLGPLFAVGDTLQATGRPPAPPPPPPPARLPPATPSPPP